MRLGIFGGTFDPPHHGHLILAAEAYDQLHLDQLLFVLTPDPPHKKGRQITPLEYRLPMLQAAIFRDPKFELSRIDIDRPPPHYAADTVELLRQQNPKAQVIYLMGGDSLVDLPTWHEPRRFLAGCAEIGVMCRPGEAIDLAELEEAIPGIAQKIRYVQAPLLEISSTEIRKRVSEGRHFRYYLPEPVYRFILDNHLYKVDNP